MLISFSFITPRWKNVSYSNLELRKSQICLHWGKQSQFNHLVFYLIFFVFETVKLKYKLVIKKHI